MDKSKIDRSMYQKAKVEASEKEHIAAPASTSVNIHLETLIITMYMDFQAQHIFLVLTSLDVTCGYVPGWEPEFPL